MVRREHDLSSTGTASWRDRDDLIGVGDYGERLVCEKPAAQLRDGGVCGDGAKVDSACAPMP